MNLKSLFTKRSNKSTNPEGLIEGASENALDMDSLDACVGGRVDSHGIDCYAYTTQPRVH